MAEYVTARGIQDEPAFAWWVPFNLSNIERIIAAVNSCVWKYPHKYGIEITTSVDHVEGIDKNNGNRFWQDAIALEMSDVGIEFKILEPGEIPPTGYTKSSGNMIYTVKMDFTRKARWVKDGHHTPDTES